MVIIRLLLLLFLFLLPSVHFSSGAIFIFFFFWKIISLFWLIWNYLNLCLNEHKLILILAHIQHILDSLTHNKVKNLKKMRKQWKIFLLIVVVVCALNSFESKKFREKNYLWNKWEKKWRYRKIQCAAYRCTYNTNKANNRLKRRRKRKSEKARVIIHLISIHYLHFLRL